MTLKHKLYAAYCSISLILVLGLNEETPLWILFLVIVNFANSARLIYRIPIK
jgi:hypothetical protein